MANKKLAEIAAKLPAEFDPEIARKQRKTLLEKKLTEAAAKQENREARLICQDIMALYPIGADPELDELVNQARQMWLKLK